MARQESSAPSRNTRGSATPSPAGRLRSDDGNVHPAPIRHGAGRLVAVPEARPPTFTPRPAPPTVGDLVTANGPPRVDAQNAVLGRAQVHPGPRRQPCTRS